MENITFGRIAPCLSVTDLPRALAFYVGVLGFEKVFENGDPWRVEAKLRYRIGDGGKLSIWYELVRPHKVIEAAVKELRATIATDTGLNILVGSLG